MWEKEINIHEIREIRVKTTAFLGVGAIKKIDFICGQLVKKGIQKVITVTGKGAYKRSGAWDHVLEAYQKHGIEYVLFDGVTPNPEVDQVDAATKIAKDFGAQSVIAIGGGSAIDAGKSVAALLKYPDKNARDLANLTFRVSEAVPIVAINLTHGTGSEVDRFSVLSIPENNFKSGITSDALYPWYAIDDPKLMVGLSPEQTTYVSLDALNHIVEACSTSVATPFSILLAQETVRLLSVYLPRVQKDPNDLEARYFLAYASLIAGTAFDNGLLHITHAMEHPLSGLKSETTHGHGLAILLPSVIKYIYDAKKNTLFTVLKPILGNLDFETATAETVSNAVKNWLKKVNMNESLRDLGFSEKDLDDLTRLTFEIPGQKGLLSIAPIEVTENIIRKIFEESL